MSATPTQKNVPSSGWVWGEVWSGSPRQLKHPPSHPWDVDCTACHSPGTAPFCPRHCHYIHVKGKAGKIKYHNVDIKPEHVDEESEREKETERNREGQRGREQKGERELAKFAINFFF